MFTELKEIFLKRKDPKTAPIKPIVITCPKENAEVLLKKIDAFFNKRGSAKLERYYMWEYIGEICPETNTGHWRLNTKGIIPKFEKLLDE